MSKREKRQAEQGGQPQPQPWPSKQGGQPSQPGQPWPGKPGNQPVPKPTTWPTRPEQSR